MADQVIPVNGMDKVGVIKDTPPVALPPNAFSDVRNVRFKDGAISKMEGEINILPNIFDDPNTLVGGLPVNYDGSSVKYLAWWANPNLAIFNQGYYLVIAEETRLQSDDSIPLEGNTDPTHQRDVAYLVSVNGTKVQKGVFQPSKIGQWQHTFFQGGFALIINNGIDVPYYILDISDNTNINFVPSFAKLPGWDSYKIDQTVFEDDFNVDADDYIYDLGQLVNFDLYEILISRENGGTVTNLTADGDTGNNGDPNNEGYTAPNISTLSTTPHGVSDEYQIFYDPSTNTTVINLPFNLTADDTLTIRVRSRANAYVSCGVIRSFGDFLVAGNLVERNSEDPDTADILRNLNGVIRTSDAAPPGAIPNNWNPFAAGVSTADEFVVANTGIVQDMVEMQGNLYIYTNSAISVMRLTGNATVPLSITPVTKSYGCQTTNAVIEFNGQHFVVGSQDIYLFGGHPGSIQSISDGRVRRYFFDNLNPLNNQNMFCLLYQQRDEIWICFPTLSSSIGECDQALIYNYRANTWTIRDLNNVIAGDIGAIPGGGLPNTEIQFSNESGNSGIINIGAQEVRTIGIDPTTEFNVDKPFYSDDSNDLVYGIGRFGEYTRIEVDGNRPFYESTILPTYQITGPEGIAEYINFVNPNPNSTTPLTATQVMDQIVDFFDNSINGWTASNLPSGYTQLTDHTRLIASTASVTLESRRTVDSSTQFAISIAAEGNTINGDLDVLDMQDSTEVSSVYGVVKADSNDYRGINVLRSTPTHIGVLISNPEHPSNQELIIVTAGENGDYNPDDHTGTNNGLSLDNEETAERLISKLKFISPTLNVIDVDTNGTLRLQPADYSDVGQFIIDIRINDTQDNTDWIWARYQEALADTIGFNNSSDTIQINPTAYGVTPVLQRQTVAPDPEGSLDSVLSPDPLRVPSRVTPSPVYATSSFSQSASTIFDIDRPWNITEVNPNKLVPIFACRKTVQDENNVEYLINKVIGTDVGWTMPSYSFLPRTETEVPAEFRYNITQNDAPEPYESYFERKQLAISPEFDTETISRVALWAQGNYRPFRGSVPNYNRVQIRMAGTDNPGQDHLLGDLEDDHVIHNNFFISENYKVDIRTHGRFLNYRITDSIHEHVNSNEGESSIVPMTSNPESDEGILYSQASRWMISGMQSEVLKGGGR